MPVLNNFEIGRRIASLREHKGLNKRQLALRLPCDPSYLWKVEKGKKPMSETLLNQLCDFFKVKKEYIIYGAGEVKSFAGKDSARKDDDTLDISSLDISAEDKLELMRLQKECDDFKLLLLERINQLQQRVIAAIAAKKNSAMKEKNADQSH